MIEPIQARRLVVVFTAYPCYLLPNRILAFDLERFLIFLQRCIKESLRFLLLRFLIGSLKLDLSVRLVFQQGLPACPGHYDQQQANDPFHMFFHMAPLTIIPIPILSNKAQRDGKSKPYQDERPKGELPLGRSPFRQQQPDPGQSTAQQGKEQRVKHAI